MRRAPSITGVRLFELADITRLKSGSLVGFGLGHAKFGAPAPQHSDQLAVVAANAIGRLLNRDDGTTGLYLDLSRGFPAGPARPITGGRPRGRH